MPTPAPQLREYGADAVADIVSRERQHRTRATVLQSAGKVQQVHTRGRDSDHPSLPPLPVL